jgi:hypothetical protein
MKKFVLLLAGIALVASCVTFKVDENEVTKVISLINKGETDKLAAITAMPFLLDGEIIALQSDSLVLWTNLKAAGITFNNAQLAELISIKEDTFKLFADTWEVSVFFKKHVPANAKLARLQTDNGGFLLLLDGERKGHAMILGIKEL